MTRRLGLIIPPMIGAAAALMLGYVIGQETAPKYDTRLIHCSVEKAPGWPPCPPAEGVEVWAVWSGGVRTLATWDGRKWKLAQTILGNSTTTIHPIAWVEVGQ